MSRESFPMFVGGVGPKLGDGASSPLTLHELDVTTKINAGLPLTSETTYLMTFHNAHARVLEGSLEFTLPEGAVISNYGLDIDGVLVDGVVVEKEKARIAFEAEVRKGVDPGILEMVKGNIFKTRVYPMPPNGKRQVRVSYQNNCTTTEAGDVVHTVPIVFHNKLARLSVTCEVSQHNTNKPQVGLQFKAEQQLKFNAEPSGGRYIAQWVGKDITPTKTIDYSHSIVLPGAGKAPFISLEANHDDDSKKGSSYFAISHQPRLQSVTELKELKAESDLPLRHLGVFWDASLSREPKDSEDKSRDIELELIKGIVDAWRTGIDASLPGDRVTVTFLAFRESADAPEVFEFGAPVTSGVDEQWNKFKTFVEKVSYDGGTNLGGLQFSRQQTPEVPYLNAYLLVTDGMCNVGQEQPTCIETPIFAINAAKDKSNGVLLKYISEISGGAYYNREGMADLKQIVQTVGRPVFQFIEAKFDKTKIYDVYPSSSMSLGGARDTRFTIAGKLRDTEATITLCYGQNRVTSHTLTVTLKQSESLNSSGILRRVWAQQKMAEYSSFPEKHKDALRDLGTKFGIVTANTSFIVLESLEQHLTHKICPPESRVEMRKQYLARVREGTQSEESRENGKINQCVGWWNTRVAWWERTHQAPPAPRPAVPIASSISSAVPTRPTSAAPTTSSISSPTPVSLNDLLSSSVRERRSSPRASSARSISPQLMMSSSAAPSADFDDFRAEEESMPIASADSEELRESIPMVSASALPPPPPPSFASAPPPMASAPSAAPPPPMPMPSASAAPPRPTSSAMPSPPPSRSAAAPGLSMASARAAPAPQMALRRSAAADSERAQAPMARAREMKESAPSPSRSSSASAPAPSPSPSLGGAPPASGEGGGSSITVQKWDPNTPYLTAIKLCVGKDGQIDLNTAYLMYIAQRKQYRASPAFYFDCASFFFNSEKKVETANTTDSKGRQVLSLAYRLGVRVLCNVVELELEQPQLLRIVGYKLSELRLLDLAISVFEKVLSMRTDEPQSYRDLAMVLKQEERDFERALTMFYKVCTGTWDSRFSEIELTAMIEMNHMLFSPWGEACYPAFQASRADIPGARPIPDPRLIKHMPVDMRIVMQWDTDMTDVDLHVIEPSGTDCCYSNKSTSAGGQMTRDFTGGYGPEEYSIKRAWPGMYNIRAKYFSSHQQSLTGATTLLLGVFKNWGRSNEEAKLITLRLQSSSELAQVATIAFGELDQHPWVKSFATNRQQSVDKVVNQLATEVTGGGIDNSAITAALTRAGYTTVEQLARADAGIVKALPGVPPAMARKLAEFVVTLK